MKRGRKPKVVRYKAINQFNFHQDYTPWNKGLIAESNKQDAPMIVRINDETLPVSRTFDFRLTQKLRPERHNTIQFSENVIVAVARVQQLVDIVNDHAKNCSSTKPPQVTINKRRGLLVYFTLSCSKNCKLPDIPMTRERACKTGPNGGHLNEQLTLACMKSKAGVQDIRLVLAALDVTPPCSSTLYKKLNATADKIIEMNEMSMLANQRLCQQDALDHGEPTLVDVQTDAAFNNRPQAGFEAGTQAFSGIIEDKRGLVLACTTANKLCRKRACSHENCQKSYATKDTISSSEKKLVESNLNKIEKTGYVGVQGITSDASSQLIKLVNDMNQNKKKRVIKHYQCLVHRMRTFQKAMKVLKLKKIRDGGEKGKLIGAFRRRIYWEVVRGSQRCFDVVKVYRAVANVIRCFTGDHRSCRKLSTVCNGTPKHQPRHLPGGMYVKLTAAEALDILAVINNYFSPHKLEAIKGTKTTNLCENVHSMVFTYAPKCTTYARNFAGLCHSAVHSKTYGPGRSTVLLAKKMDLSANEVKTPFNKLLECKDKKANYDAARQVKRQYKRMRYLSLMKKLNKTEQTGSA
jgi:hypothetical protein